MFDLIFGVLFAVLGALIALFPAFSAPFDIFACDAVCAPSSGDPGIGALGQSLYWANGWFDLALFSTLFGLAVAALAVFGVVWLAIWTYNHLPGKAA